MARRGQTKKAFSSCLACSLILVIIVLLGNKLLLGGTMVIEFPGRVQRPHRTAEHTDLPQSVRHPHTCVTFFHAPGLVCPIKPYMGLLNALQNTIQCLLIVSSLGCNATQVYLPFSLQRNSLMYDLFSPEAFHSLENAMRIRITFYCDGVSGLLSPLPEVSFRHKHPPISLRRHKDCIDIGFHKAMVLPAARELSIFESWEVLPRMRVLLEHPARRILWAKNRIQKGLQKPYVGVHLRLEDDAWATIDMFNQNISCIKSDFFFNISYRNFRRQLSPLEQTLPVYGTYRVLGHHGVSAAPFHIKYKEDFLFTGGDKKDDEEENYYVASMQGYEKGVTIVEKVGKEFNVSNVSIALVDLLVLWDADVLLVARYSSFGTTLRDLRCLPEGGSWNGTKTFEYGKDLSVYDPCIG